MRNRGFYDMIALGRRSEGASAAFCKSEIRGAKRTDFGLKRRTDFESETNMETKLEDTETKPETDPNTKMKRRS